MRFFEFLHFRFAMASGLVSLIGFAKAPQKSPPNSAPALVAPISNCGIELNVPYATWAKLPVKIYTASGLPEIFVAATKDAVQKWNTAIGREMLVFGGVSKSCKNTPMNCVVLEPSGSYLAVSGQDDYAFTKQNFLGKHWSGADVYLNAAVNWARPAAVSEVDPYDVVLHELGHVLGLQHHFFHLNSVMNYIPFESGASHLDITPFDLSLLSWLYNGEPCPPAYLLAFVDGQDRLSLDLLKKAYSDLSQIKDVNLLYMMSRLERSLGLFEDSMRSIDAAIDATDASEKMVLAYLYNHRADLYFRKLNYHRALKDFDRSLKLAPGSYQAMTYVAHLKYLLGKDSKDILEGLDRALAIKPGFTRAKDLRAKIVAEESAKTAKK